MCLSFYILGDDTAEGLMLKLNGCCSSSSMNMNVAAGFSMSDVWKEIVIPDLLVCQCSCQVVNEQNLLWESSATEKTSKHFSLFGVRTWLAISLCVAPLRVVSGSRDATLRVWDIETGQCLHVLMGHVAAVRCVQYDGRRVVSGAYDFMVKVWDPETETCLHTLQGHTNRVYSLQVGCSSHQQAYILSSKINHCTDPFLNLKDIAEMGFTRCL